MANSLNNKLKQAWQKCKRLLVSDLVKLTACQEFIIRKQCLENENNMLQEHIMANQGIVGSYSKHTTKSLSDHEPKGIKRYNCKHVNIAKHKQIQT